MVNDGLQQKQVTSKLCKLRHNDQFNTNNNTHNEYISNVPSESLVCEDQAQYMYVALKNIIWTSQENGMGRGAA